MFRVLTLLCALIFPLSAQVAPVPHSVKEGGKKFWFTRPHLVVDDPALKPVVEAFSRDLEKLVEGELFLKTGTSASSINFKQGELPEGKTYQIVVSFGNVQVTVKNAEGAAHATATLLQSVILEKRKATVGWPEGTILDGPQHAYRSFMVDMGRNPHSPKMLRHVIDMMWFYKANYLHLHLTDDQLFSWPSKAYPKLYSKRAGWTWDDFVKLEEYAQARGVTIIPELDVPGHSTILRKQYPEVFGKTPTDLASKPEAQKGVETLIQEMLSVFKSTPYFHMGGDEAYGVPQEIQRDFINRLNTFIKSQGKQTLAWEGPHLGKGDNKVATDVIHINWRGVEFPAQQMLDAGYQIVHAPWDPLYVVDHYPRTMFTAVDVERCYNWNIRRFAHINHAMAHFKNPHITKSAEGILGFCMPWWEGREENILPLCLPRFAAVASAAWNRKGENDFPSFQKRQEILIPRLEKLSGFTLPKLPFADPETQKDNLAFKAKVTPSDGASQPHFGPQRLTNGIPDRFDHFLGFPTRPKPLEIVVELDQRSELGRVRIYEAAVRKSYEQYELLVSADGQTFEKVGESKEGTRGENNFVDHKFPSRKVKFIKIATDGCQNLTFPSFSRLTEVKAFAK